jgi:hypothetical protein
MRTPSRLELTYIGCGDALVSMVAEGAFPVAGSPTGSRRGAPRVGDGLLRLDVDGLVEYASPNAVSAYHRLGYERQLEGVSLAEVTTGLMRARGQVDEGLPLVLTGKAPWRADVDGKSTALSVRAIPLVEHGRRVGALLLVRDVTELRRRERELLSKDATIREITTGSRTTCRPSPRCCGCSPGGWTPGPAGTPSTRPADGSVPSPWCTRRSRPASTRRWSSTR